MPGSFFKPSIHNGHWVFHPQSVPLEGQSSTNPHVPDNVLRQVNQHITTPEQASQ